MSGSIELVVLVPALIYGGAVVGGAVGAGMAQAGYMLAEGSAAAVKAGLEHLRGEYDAAYGAFMERSRMREQLLAERGEEHAQQQRFAEELKQLTSIGARGDATLELLSVGLARIEDRLGPLSPPPTDLLAAVTQLRSDLGTGVDPAELIERYQRLAALAAEALEAALADAPDAEQTRQERVVALRKQLADPSLQQGELAERHAELSRQLELLEQMSESQAGMALAGLPALRRSIARLHSAAEKIQLEQQLKHAAFAEKMARMGAALQAMSSAQVESGLRAQAETLRRRLAEALAAPSQQSALLDALAAEAEALYHSHVEREERRLKQAIIEDNLKDVLQGMGYQVSTIDGPGDNDSQVVSIDDLVGVELTVSEQGKVHSEMLAFDAGRLDAAAQREEEVCALMDQVFARLRERQLEVRERVRRPLQHPLELKLAEKPKRHDAPLTQVNQPLKRTLDGDS